MKYEKICFYAYFAFVSVDLSRHDINLHMIIYTLTPRNLIFKNDPNYNKVAKTKDSKINYENTVYDRMGYLNTWIQRACKKASKEDSSCNG